MSAAELQKYDIVITTYQTVTGEYEENGIGKTKKKKSNRALFEVAWKVCRPSLRPYSSVKFS
jgi:SWI/SNF-related matrix-associated actin-dependent regulator of chromatin subfamily A3